jgi:hypothetical protein
MSIRSLFKEAHGRLCSQLRSGSNNTSATTNPTSNMSRRTKPTLIISVDEATFDISPWDTEGYAVHLLTKANEDSIEYVTDELESNDRYAILGTPHHHLSI